MCRQPAVAECPLSWLPAKTDGPRAKSKKHHSSASAMSPEWSDVRFEPSWNASLNRNCDRLLDLGYWNPRFSKSRLRPTRSSSTSSELMPLVSWKEQPYRYMSSRFVESSYWLAVPVLLTRYRWKKEHHSPIPLVFCVRAATTLLASLLCSFPCTHKT